MKKSRKQCPNPLFETWITEWYEKAKAENNPTQYGFAKALQSLRKCPLAFDRGQDCLLLEYFGTKLCRMLDKKLEEHKKLKKCNSQVNVTNDVVSTNSKQNTEQYNIEDEITEVIPKGSCTYAILRALHEIKIKTPPGYLTLKQLKTEMLQYYDSSPNQNEQSHLSSLTELINKGFVHKMSPPIRYGITDSGTTEIIKLSNEKTGIIYDNDNSFTKFCEENKEPNPCVKQSQLSLNYSKLVFGIKEMNLECKESVEGNKVHRSEELITVDKCAVIETVLSKTNAIFPLNKQTFNVDGNKNGNINDNAIEVVHNFQESDYFILEPNTFDIILLVDIHETNSKTTSGDDQTVSKLTSLKTKFLVRHLNIGDFAWIARCRKTDKELILPYIVERKRVDDLSSSIKDGRFHEQKFRLKRSGIPKQIYLVEGLNKNVPTGIPLKSLLQASINSLVQDGFALKYTNSHKDSMIFLSLLTTSFINQYKNKRLISCKKNNLETAKNTDDTECLMDFAEFNKSSSKMKDLKVQEMFVRQLAQMKGVSIDKALAITKIYPTPCILYHALIKSGENLLADIKVGYSNQLIGSTISQAIHKFYTKTELN